MQIGGMILLISKISLVLLFLLLALALLRHESAARRTLATQLSLIALLLLPLLWGLLPSTKIVLPLAWSAITDAPLVIPDLPGIAWFAPMPLIESDAFPWVMLCLAIYFFVASLLMLSIFWSIVRLHRLPARLPRQLSTEIRLEAQLVWQEKLTELCQLYSIRRPVRLLISDHVRSPISWGLFHPVIMVDVTTINNFPPDDVLRHELAHIANFDWVSLILGRVICALYWFHPLVWLMFRHLTFNMECKTDDVVLTRGATASEYAQTLMQISQQAQAPEPAATPLAGQGRSLMTRLVAILEPQTQRHAVGTRLWVWSVLATIIITFPLGTLAFIGEQITWPDALFKNTAHVGVHAGKMAADELDKLNNPNFTTLAQALRSENYEQRHAIDIESFRQRAAIAPLVLALHDTNPKVRRLALWGFGEMRFNETGPVIALMLKDSDALVRGEAARALAELQDTAWTMDIIPLLQDTNAFVRASAAHALGDLRDPRSSAALKAGLHDRHPDVLEEIRWALSQLDQ
jgi:hypothetical protein